MIRGWTQPIAPCSRSTEGLALWARLARTALFLLMVLSAAAAGCHRPAVAAGWTQPIAPCSRSTEGLALWARLARAALFLLMVFSAAPAGCHRPALAAAAPTLP